MTQQDPDLGPNNGGYQSDIDKHSKMNGDDKYLDQNDLITRTSTSGHQASVQNSIRETSQTKVRLCRHNMYWVPQYDMYSTFLDHLSRMSIIDYLKL